jgi:hypothetical protein
MSFWTYCCKFPQVHRPFTANPQYPRDNVSAGGTGIPELKGCTDPSIDNEGDWKVLSDYAGIMKDGTLWCWIPEIVGLDSFKSFGFKDPVFGIYISNDGFSGGGRPVQISTDTDWAFVTSDGFHGFAIKSGGALYAFGRNTAGNLGIGLGNTNEPDPSQMSGFDYYRGRLSTGIKSVSGTGGSFSGKPTATVIGGPAGLLGSGATFEVEWTGAPSGGGGLTNAGSGYTSAPTVALVGDSEEDAGKRVELPVTVVGGSISFVNYSRFYDEIWTSIPKFEVTGGGGGSGATFYPIQSVVGSVKSIKVVNPGSGYTQSFKERLKIRLTYGEQVYDDIAGAFNVQLIPSKVTQIIPATPSIFTISHPRLMKASDGKLFPFSMLGNSTVRKPTDFPAGNQVESAYIVKAGGAATQISNDFTSATTITGCRYPPFLKAYWAFSARTQSGNIEHQIDTTCVDECCESSARKFYGRPGGAGGDWPCGNGGGTVTGTGSTTYKNVDGWLINTSSEYGFIKTGNNAFDFNYNTEYPPGIPFTYSRYTGRIAATVTPILNAEPTPQWPSDTTIYRGDVWVTPTIEHKFRIYFSPPQHGGNAAYGEAGPVGGDSVYGYGTSPTLVSDGGGLYDFEPSSYAVKDFFEFPVRVGQDSWKSVSAYGSQSYGVNTSGELYWWGESTACGWKQPCVTPSPVGRGVTLDISDVSYRDVLGPVPSSGNYGGFGPNRYSINSADTRVCVSVPDHGVYAFLPKISYLTEERTSPARYKKTASLKAAEFFSPETNLLTRQGCIGGLGYTSQPTVEYLHPGEPAATFTARLIGESKFTDVIEDCARGQDGRWYYCGHGAGYGATSVYAGGEGILGLRGPVNQYEYTVTTKTQNGGIYASALDSQESTAVRTVARTAIPTWIAIKNGGSGYTSGTVSYTSAPADISAHQNQNWQAAPSRTIEGTTSCNGYPYPTKYTDVQQYTLPAQTSTLRTEGVVAYNGALGNWTIGLGYANGAVSVSPSVTGDGSGASVVVVQNTEAFECQLLALTPTGIDKFFRSNGIGLRNGTIVSFNIPYFNDNYFGTRPINLNSNFQYNQLVLESYETPDFTGTKLVGKTLRKSDSSIWSISGGLQTFLPTTAISRVFPASLTLETTGSGYADVASATVSQQAGVATATAVYSASVTGVGVIDGGSGYTSPPSITLTASDGIGSPGTATAVIAGPISKVNITAAGSGYRVPPRVVFSGAGIHANATCTLDENGGVGEVIVSDGGRYRNAGPTVSFQPIVQVETISLTSGGSGYTSAPDVFIGGGGGVGATATAAVSPEGVVTSVTLTSRGEDFVIPPTVVFYNGGGGSGAEATATLSSPGSGAAGTAVLNGSVIFCTHAGSSGLQKEPTVTVSQPPAGGSAARIGVRIAGTVTGVTVTNGGNSYKASTDYTSLPPLFEKKLPAIAQIRDEMAEYASNGNRASGMFDAGHARLIGTVSGDAISSFTIPANLSQLRFWKKPEVVAIDGVSAVPKTCLTLRSVAVRSAATNTGTIRSNRVASNGAKVNYYASTLSGGSVVENLAMAGSLSSRSFNDTGIEQSIRDSYSRGVYSTMPTVTLEDEAGSGATIGPMSSATIVSGGSGYTLGARLVIKGGTPAVWSNKAVLTATVADGKVASITVESGGGGYLSGLDIFIIGGGGTGATAGVSGFNYTTRSITAMTITNAGSGYTSAPKVVVVDRERPWEFAYNPKLLGYVNGTRSVEYPVLQNFKVEYGMISESLQRQMTIDSPVIPVKGIYSATFVPFFKEDGYVEGVLWSMRSGIAPFCCVRDFTTAPTVTAVGPCTTPATFSTKIEKWSDVFSQYSLKSEEES